MLNETHDVALSSWVASAQQPGHDFPIQNLPFAVFCRRGSTEPWRGGVAIGDSVLDLQQALALDVFDGLARSAAEAAVAPHLNALMAMGPTAWSALRLALSRLLRQGSLHAAPLQACLVQQREVQYTVPTVIGDYTDFLSSAHHMANMAQIFTPGAPIVPNFRWQPLAYHGRASTVEVSGTSFARPCGQTRPPGTEQPGFGPTRRLDYEMELGFFVGPGTQRGQRVDIEVAEDHIFGVCLLNDWSARDVQGWEATPLGPFLSKSFITTISPWVVTLEALAPYRCAPAREPGDPPALDYLRPQGPRRDGGFDIQLEVLLRTLRSQDADMRLSRSNFRHAYWTLAQMLTHHAEGGCRLRSGDLMGTGTQSGPLPGEEGCLMEMTRGGQQAIALPNGESRSFLEDGDTVTLRAWCEAHGAARIGFGVCAGTVLPALA